MLSTDGSTLYTADSTLDMCTCPGYVGGDRCKHLDAVKALDSGTADDSATADTASVEDRKLMYFVATGESTAWHSES